LAALIISALSASGQETDIDVEADLSAPVEFDFPPNPDSNGLYLACADELEISMAALMSIFEDDMASVAGSIIIISGAGEVNRLRRRLVFISHHIGSQILNDAGFFSAKRDSGFGF